jgi:hypothetical protein
MTDTRVHQLETIIREETYTRNTFDPPDRDMYRWLRHKLTLIEPDLRRQDVLRLEGLIERRTGVKA